jgi:hypothetical protein
VELPVKDAAEFIADGGLIDELKLFQRYQKTWSSISAAEKLREVLEQAKQKEKPVDKMSKKRNGRGRYRRLKRMNAS